MNSGATNVDYAAKKEKLFNDLGGVVSGASDVLKEAANASIEKLSSAKEDIRDVLKAKVADTKAKLDQGKVAVKHAADVTNQYVSDHPWKVIGIAAATALLVGFFLRRD